MKAAGYTRVSTDEQAERGLSLLAQRTASASAPSEGWELTEVYEDAGWSGSREDRPALQRLRADATAGAFDVLIGLGDGPALARHAPDALDRPRTGARWRPTTVNANQADQDGDSLGDACDSDRDGDGIPNLSDTCPNQAANTQDGCPSLMPPAPGPTFTFNITPSPTPAAEDTTAPRSWCARTASGPGSRSGLLVFRIGPASERRRAQLHSEAAGSSAVASSSSASEPSRLERAS